MDFIVNGELQDWKIVNALRLAAENYENGELLEVRDVLVDIVNAINAFEVLEG